MSLKKLPLKEAQQLWEEKYNRSMAPCRGYYDIMAHLDRPMPGLEVEIRRFRMPEAVLAEEFKMEVCYLSLAVTPRPIGMKVDYLGSRHRHAFTAYGSCCFVPAGQNTYTYGCVGEYQEVCCLFDPELFEPYVDWQWTPLELAACFDIKNINIQNCLLRLAEEANNPGYASKTVVKGLFNVLLVELSRHFRSARSLGDKIPGKLSPRHLRLINEKVKSCLDQDLHIDTLANLCGVSGRHLSRMFKTTTGQTLGKYISKERINRAKILLSQPDCLIKEVAFKCGFQSQSSFSQAFHDATGQTPSQFRDNSRNTRLSH